MTLPLRRVGMAATGNLSEEQVHCSICLDVFTNPVSIPCGHNFCQACILGYWKTSPLYQCPMCKKSFHKRPDISVNTVLREIAEQFKQIRVKSLLGAGALHPEGSGRAGSGHRGEAEADGGAGRGSHHRAGAGNLGAQDAAHGFGKCEQN
uniref:RING-type domain-containing protein n=1 Tax=Xiphophorus maculatus TaxID=8083 RepID=A0A3B5PWI1_XIPMA